MRCLRLGARDMAWICAVANDSLVALTPHERERERESQMHRTMIIDTIMQLCHAAALPLVESIAGFFKLEMGLHTERK